jgi:hypothetical protein
MKALTSWLCDPCVHLFVIGLLLVRMAMSAGSEPDLAALDDDGSKICRTCRKYHEAPSACPVARRISEVASDAE